jgi:hypothetical protein
MRSLSDEEEEDDGTALAHILLKENVVSANANEYGDLKRKIERQIEMVSCSIRKDVWAGSLS